MLPNLLFISNPLEAEILYSQGLEKELGDFQPTKSTDISLKGSRNETLFAVAYATKKGCDTLQIDSPSLPVAVYKIETYKASHHSYPNSPIGEIDDRLILGRAACATSDKPAKFLLEINVPRTTAPGEYEISTSYAGESSNGKIKVSVWSMTLPPRPALPIYIGLPSYSILLGHFKKWHQSEGELFLKYQKLLLNHRIYPLSAGGVKAPDVRKGKDSAILDVVNSPSKSLAMKNLILDEIPRSAYVEIPKLYNLSEREKLNYYTAIVNTPLLRKRKLLSYVWDEPQKGQYREMIRELKLLKAAAPSIMRMVTMPAFEEFHDLIDIFVPVINYFDKPDMPSRSTYRKLQRDPDPSKRKEIWWYASCMSHGCHASVDTKVPDLVIDRPIASIRAIAWLSYRYHIQGFLYYNSVESYQYYAKDRDPYFDQWYFSGNGDGTLIYPGRVGENEFTEHHPVPSLRLKALQEVTYDSNYLSLMRVVRGTHPTVYKNLRERIRKLVRKTDNFSLDYNEYQTLKEDIGDAIEESFRQQVRARRVRRRR